MWVTFLFRGLFKHVQTESPLFIFCMKFCSRLWIYPANNNLLTFSLSHLLLNHFKTLRFFKMFSKIILQTLWECHFCTECSETSSILKTLDKHPTKTFYKTEFSINITGRMLVHNFKRTLPEHLQRFCGCSLLAG